MLACGSSARAGAGSRGAAPARRAAAAPRALTGRSRPRRVPCSCFKPPPGQPQPEAPRAAAASGAGGGSGSGSGSAEQQAAPFGSIDFDVPLPGGNRGAAGVETATGNFHLPSPAVGVRNLLELAQVRRAGGCALHWRVALSQGLCTRI